MSVSTPSSLVETNADLPEGWLLSRLPEVCEINPPKAALDALEPEQPVTFVPMPAVDAKKGAITAAQERSFSDVRKGFTSFQDNDVIMAKITPCMENGKAAIARGLVNGLGFGSTEFHVLRSNGAVLPEFVYHFIRQESFRRDAETEMTGSVGQKRVPVSFLETTELPLAPLAEQERIVERVEQLLGWVNAVRERLTSVKLTLKRFRQGVLAAACSGRLTADWRDTIKSSQEDDWREVQLAEICSSIADGDHQPPPKRTLGIPFLTIGNISSGRLDFSETRFVPEEYFATIKSERKPRKGDVLYTVVGATIGIPVIVNDDRPFCFQRHIALLRPSSETTSDFLWTLLASPRLFKEAWSRITGTAQPTLPLGNLRTIPINLPPLAEQGEIVHRVKALFTLADAIERRVEASTTHANKLTQAIVGKAFRGELVPTEAGLARRENRSYETAAELLARTQSERVDQKQTSSLQKEKRWPTRSKRKTRNS